MNALESRMHARSRWYSEGLRWVGGLLSGAADYLERATPAREPLAPMPRHTSYDEIVGDLRNRLHAGVGTQRHS